MDYVIREIKKEEYVLLNDFLYEAIYIPDGVEPPPKSIINCPELQEYVFEFGKRKDDRALVAEVQGCWWKREEQLAKKQHHTGSTCR